MKKLHAIPTNLVMGFLGVGKTSAILDLLKQKPAEEKWAVLVNEYGDIGIDGAILSNQGATVKEVPGGCICCAVGLPFQVAINRLLAQAKPDRLLIEPSGLAHPQKILEQLSNPPFETVLALKASICLVDPRKLNSPRYCENETFIDQIALADILVANKIDLADVKSIQLFTNWATKSDPGKTVIAQTKQGKLKLAWLDFSRNSKRNARFSKTHNYHHSSESTPPSSALQGFIKSVPDHSHHQHDKFQNYGRIYPSGEIFDYIQLSDYLAQYSVERLKALFNTDKGWFIYNRSEELLSITETAPANDSRIEIISARSCWDQLEKELFKFIINLD